jgi:4-amino-4-deoxy-L-arabinose transferase-like glycosyltransferase
MGQALLVVPAFGLVYLVAGPTRVRTRLLQLLAALVAVVVSAGWFVALVELWPADSRPYIGGSTTNSLLELALSYNGLGRILGGSGNGGGNGGGGGGNGGFGGDPGLLRLFTDELGLEISWLLPAALIALLALVWISRRAPRTDRLGAAALLWGGWTLVTALVFSFMSGTMHPYYTLTLAPGIAALVGVSARALWVRRASFAARATLALMTAVTAAWSAVLLAGSTESFAWVGWVVVALAVPAVIGLLVGSRAALVAALLTGLLGAGAVGVATAAVPHTGSIPSVGTSTTGGGPGGMPNGQRPALPAGASTDGQPPAGGIGTTANSELTAQLAVTDSTWSAAVSTSSKPTSPQGGSRTTSPAARGLTVGRTAPAAGSPLG